MKKTLPFYSIHPNKTLVEESILKHVASKTVQTARFDEITEKYHYVKNGAENACGGLHKALRYKYYGHYKDNRSRRSRGTKIRGSTKQEGIMVDRQIQEYTAVGGKGRPKRCGKKTERLLSYWERKGHVPQAAQLPMEMIGWNRMTQADYITRDANGELWLWEVKSGFPIGFSRKQGFFQGGLKDERGNPLPCTKANIWQLQLFYTRKSLEAAGVNIAHSRIIQVYAKRGAATDLIVDIHKPAPWLGRLEETMVLGGVAVYKPVVIE